MGLWSLIRPKRYINKALLLLLLDAFRLHGYQANKLGHYWELSYDIFDRIDVSVSNRNSYVSYMKENPLVAKRKKVNIKGI